MARTKEVAHVWAHQGAKRKAIGNVFFEGASIFSYGRHFEMGRLVTRNGRTVALLATNTYSSSTANHKGYTHQATSHMTQFHVPQDANGRLDLKPGVMFKAYKPRLIETLKKARRARVNKADLLVDARKIVTEANEFAEFFGLSSRLEMPADIDAAIAEAKEAEKRVEARANAAARKRERERLAEEQKAREEAMAVLERWKQGERVIVPRVYQLPVALRISPDGKAVETSQGVTVPVEHARRAYRIGKRLRERHETYQANGHSVKVGHYRIDQMNEEGEIVAGCHRFKWADVEGLAKVAGWDGDAGEEMGEEELTARD